MRQICEKAQATNLLRDFRFINDINGLDRKHSDDGSQTSARLDGWALPAAKRQGDATFGDAIKNLLFQQHFLAILIFLNKTGPAARDS